MQYLQIILALGAAVSAVDIQAHTESHCRANGQTLTWQNVDPNTCTSSGGTHAAFSFSAVP
jgi:hypothetical protein